MRQATPFSPIPGPRAVHLEAPARALKLARLCPSCRCPLVSPAADSEAVSVDPWRLGGEPGRTRWGPGAATKGPPCWAVYSESSTPQGRTRRPLPWREEGWVRLPERRTVRFRPVSPRPPARRRQGRPPPPGPSSLLDSSRAWRGNGPHIIGEPRGTTSATGEVNSYSGRQGDSGSTKAT